MSCAKRDEPIKMIFGMWTQIGPRKHVLGGGDRSRVRGAVLGRPRAMQLLLSFVVIFRWGCWRGRWKQGEWDASGRQGEETKTGIMSPMNVNACCMSDTLRCRVRFILFSMPPYAVSKGMWAVKLCTNKILQFLAGGALPLLFCLQCFDTVGWVSGRASGLRSVKI